MGTRANAFAPLMNGDDADDDDLLWPSEDTTPAAPPSCDPAPTTPADPPPPDDKPYTLQALDARIAEEVLMALRMTTYVPRQVFERRRAITAAAVAEAEPLDEIEGMLLAQMMAAHSRGMGLILKSLDPEPMDQRLPAIHLLAATRLLSLARRQSHARMRYRDWLEERERRARGERRKARRRRKP
jgi:hypothetical protein